MVQTAPEKKWMGHHPARAAHTGLVIGMTAISCGGKSYIAKHLTAEGAVNPHFTVTDRAKRPDESDLPYDHHFVSKDEFTDMRRRGDFLIHCVLYGHNYGLTPIPEPAHPDKPTMILIKPQVAQALRQVVPTAIIYAIESSDGLGLAEANMRMRGQSEEDIAARLAVAAQEEMAGRSVADDGRHFISDGHPREILGAVRNALIEDQAAYREQWVA